MKEIQGKSILVRVSARFELVRVRGAHESPTLVNYPLLSDFCHFKKKFMFACPLRKMAKLGQKLQFSHSDVIHALLGLGRTIDIFVRNLGMIVQKGGHSGECRARNVTLWNIWTYRRLDRYVADAYMTRYVSSKWQLSIFRRFNPLEIQTAFCKLKLCNLSTCVYC